MKKIIITVLILISIILNILLGYWYFKELIYQRGFDAGQITGQQVMANQVNLLIQQGQLIIPQNEQTE
jgi:hypothetical protein